jgi:tetratricopeptide (TPR) repeat protein
VQIPLDYYRILGLPVQATLEQLQQAHRDRGLQLPRREFSEVVIKGRKDLIDEAYEVLSDPDRRRQYDSKFLTNIYGYGVESSSSATPEGADSSTAGDIGEATLRSLATEARVGEESTSTIDIDDQHLTGALLILLEMGEYEQVIDLARPYFNASSGSWLASQAGNGQADLVLILALAYLELGREQWQQRQYEVAANSLEKGQDLLVQQNLFTPIRAEIQAELYKLRPYRILELVAGSLDQTRERRQGLKLLRTMLEDRGGIEGGEDDLSGLAIDDFLRFIQQLRDYLTTTEQQELFEQEVRRPSPVAIYLTVYALLARGFASHQPVLIRRAKQLLLRLGNHQDVHLEQAVCAMLLGQTEEASRALELSQEYEPLAYIREHSRHSPDLLPGLCLYTERWLKEELFPHFRDLKDQSAALKDYFADPQVQAYLESMVASPESNRSVWPDQTQVGAMQDQPTPRPAPASSQGPGPVPPERFGRSTAPLVQPGQSRVQPTQVRARPLGRSGVPIDHVGVGVNGKNAGRSGGRDLGSQDSQSGPPLTPGPDSPSLSVAERVARLSPEGKLAASPDQSPSSDRQKGRRRVSSGRDARSVGSLAPGQAFPSGPQPGWRAQASSTSPRWGRLLLVGLVGLLGLGTLGFLTMRTVGWALGSFSGPRLKGAPLEISVAEPAIPIPPPGS